MMQQKQGEIKGELATGAFLAYQMYLHSQDATAQDVASYLLQTMQHDEDITLVSIPELIRCSQNATCKAPTGL